MLRIMVSDELFLRLARLSEHFQAGRLQDGIQLIDLLQNDLKDLRARAVEVQGDTERFVDPFDIQRESN